MSGVASAIGGAAVLGAVVSSNSASKGAAAQQNAANTASQTQLQMYNQTRQDQTPWRTAGGNAISALSSYYGLPGANGAQPNLAQTGLDDNKLISSLPGYQFNLDQGQQAVERNLASKGLLSSGAGAKALLQYGQGYAENAANDYTNGLKSIAGIGQSSVQATGAAGANAANQVGSNQIYSGNAQATGYANQSNAINQGLSGLTGAFGQYQGYQNMQQQANNYGAMNGTQTSPSSTPGTFNYGGYIVNGPN